MDYFELAKQYETEFVTFECRPTLQSKVTNSTFSYATVDEYRQIAYISIGRSEEDFINKLEDLSKNGPAGHYKLKIPRSRDELQEIYDINELSKGTRFKFVRNYASHRFAVFFGCDGDFTNVVGKLNVMYPEDGENIKYNTSLKEAVKNKNRFAFNFMEFSFMFDDSTYVDMLLFFLSEHDVRLHKIHIQVDSLEEAKYYMNKLQ